MAGVDKSNIDTALEEIEGINRTAGENWAGEAGGRGIRALTRYLYRAPDRDQLAVLRPRTEPFMMVTPA